MFSEMKKCIIFLLMSFLLSFGLQADNHALLIGVGNYPSTSGWGKISSVNDVRLLGNLLYDKFQVDSLLDENATYEGILGRLEELLEQSVEGDTVLVHFSSHGQQIYTRDPFEPDYLDEAIVPYDAFSKKSSFYDGEHHLRDDEIGLFIDRLRNKLGQYGLAVITVDSCFSDSMNKGGNEENQSNEHQCRGGMEIFNIESIPADTLDLIMESMMSDDQVKFLQNPQKSDVVLISACKSYQKNREIEIAGIAYGALSYSMYDSFLHNDFSNMSCWLSGVLRKMSEVAFSQNPQVRSTIEILSDSIPEGKVEEPESAVIHVNNCRNKIIVWCVVLTLISIMLIFVLWKKRNR